MSAEPDYLPADALAEEEPKYLRRQKPLEIKRRKFGKKAWKTYARVAAWSVAGVALAGTCYAMGNFLLSSRHMALLQRDQHHRLCSAAFRHVPKPALAGAIGRHDIVRREVSLQRPLDRACIQTRLESVSLRRT